MKVEEGLRVSGKLNRNQTVIMWLLFSETRRTGKTSLPRKEVVKLMTGWYEITSSSVSKAVQALAKPPLEFITVEKDPNSGREVVIALTKVGRKHCTSMVESAARVVDKLAHGLTLEEAQLGIHVMRRMDEEFHR